MTTRGQRQMLFAREMRAPAAHEFDADGTGHRFRVAKEL
jgi:hypothetical protein